MEMRRQRVANFCNTHQLAPRPVGPFFFLSTHSAIFS
jgi:hypothetical protein